MPSSTPTSRYPTSPGLNRCDIGEDETTYALNALYSTQVPATGGLRTAAAGDLVEKSKKHGIDQDEHKTSKKTKKVDQHHFDRDWNHGCDLTDGKVPDETKTFPAKEKTIASSCEQGDISLHKGKVSSKYDLLEKTKKIDDEDAAFGKENKQHHEDMERLDLSGKKKIVKEREKIQKYSVDHVSKGEKNENSKERKPKIMKCEELMSKVDTRSVKVWDADTMLSSADGCLNNELVADNKYVTGKEVPSELWENLPPRQALESAEPNRNPDAAYLQTSTVATSSSSKISSSQRNKNSQEAKGSPVDSVSSSPLGNFNSAKLSHGRMTGKGGSLNADSSAVSCGKKQSQELIGKEKSQHSIDNQKMRNSIVAQVAHMHLKEDKSEVHSTPVKSDASKMKAHLRGSNVEIDYQHGIMRQAISNNSGIASPIRKDNGMVVFALKDLETGFRPAL